MPDAPADRSPNPERATKIDPGPRKNPSGPSGAPNWRSFLWYVPVMLLLLWVWQDQLHQISVKTIPYSQFKQYLAAGEVAECEVKDLEISGRIVPKEAAPKAPAPATGKVGETKRAAAPATSSHPAATGKPSSAPPTEQPGEAKEESKPFLFRTERVEPDAQLVAQLEAAKVTFSAVRPSLLSQFLVSWVLPIGVMVVLWVFLSRGLRTAGQSVMSFGKSRARLGGRPRHGRHLRRRGRLRRGQVRTSGGRRFSEEPQPLHRPGRQDSQGRAAGRAARHRQDAAVARGGRRGPGAVLLAQRQRLRGDVRGRGSGAGPRPVRAGPAPGPLHRLHRRIGRHRARAGRAPRPGQRRARTDPQPTPGRDGRLPGQRGRDPPGGHQPPRGPGPGPAAARPLRPPGGDRRAGHGRAGGDPESPLPRQTPGRRRRPAKDRPGDARLLRGRPGQRRQRGRAAGRAPQGQARSPRGTWKRPSRRWWPARSARAAAWTSKASAAWPITKWAMPWSPPTASMPTRYTRSASCPAAAPPWAIPCSCPPTTSSCSPAPNSWTA